jgi:hypothetical protein
VLRSKGDNKYPLLSGMVVDKDIDVGHYLVEKKLWKKRKKKREG